MYSASESERQPSKTARVASAARVLDGVTQDFQRRSIAGRQFRLALPQGRHPPPRGSGGAARQAGAKRRQQQANARRDAACSTLAQRDRDGGGGVFVILMFRATCDIGTPRCASDSMMRALAWCGI
jgi:hypothetical protein